MLCTCVPRCQRPGSPHSPQALPVFQQSSKLHRLEFMASACAHLAFPCHGSVALLRLAHFDGRRMLMSPVGVLLASLFSF